MFHVGDVIRKLRLKQGHRRQKSFAERAGVDTATVSRVEMRGRYDPDTLQKMAVALGFPGAAELLLLVPEPSMTNPVTPVLDPEVAEVAAKYAALNHDQREFVRQALMYAAKQSSTSETPPAAEREPTDATEPKRNRGHADG